jgi:hypothetical protein
MAAFMRKHMRITGADVQRQHRSASSRAEALAGKHTRADGEFTSTRESVTAQKALDFRRHLLRSERRLGDLEANLEQLTMNAGAPQRGFAASSHSRDLWDANTVATASLSVFLRVTQPRTLASAAILTLI